MSNPDIDAAFKGMDSDMSNDLTKEEFLYSYRKVLE